MNPYVNGDDMPVEHKKAYWYVFNTQERDGYFAAIDKQPYFPEEMTQFVVKSFDDYLTKNQLDVEIARILGVRLDAIDLPEEQKDYIKKEVKLKEFAMHWEKWRNETKFSIRAYAKQVLSFGYEKGGVKIHDSDATRLNNQDPTVPDEIINIAYDQMMRWKMNREANVL